MAGLSFFKGVRKVFGSLAIIIPVLALSGCGEGDGPTGITNTAVAPLNLPAGFCDPINFEIECEPPGIIWFGGGQTIIVENPDKSGINQSDSVGRMQKFGDQPFGGTRLNPVEVPVDFSAGEAYKMKVWSERAVPVTFKVEQDSLFLGGTAEVVVSHSGGSVWEELCFDFSSKTIEAAVFGLTIIFDNGVLGQSIGGVFSGDWTFYYDDITQVESCSDTPPTGITPEVSLYDPTVMPPIPADVDVTAFGSLSVIIDMYADDTSYSPVLAVSSGTGYGANIAQIGFTGGEAGFLSEFTSLDFKVKGMPNNVIFVKLFDGVDSLRINLTSSAYSDELTDGWYQVSIPISAFNGVSLATGIVFESDDTAPMQFTMLLNDIGFMEVDDNGGGTDPGGSVVPDASILEADGSAADLTAVFTGFDSGTGTEIVADTTYAQALEVTVADAYAPGALNLAQLFITELSSLDSYDEFVFKVKGLTDNNLVMKIEPPAGGTSVAIDLAAPGAGITAEALSDGWTQVVVSLAQFGDLSAATLVILQTLDNAYALGDTFLLTDIGFNTPGGGNGGGVATLGVYSETNTDPFVTYVLDILSAGNTVGIDGVSTAVTPFDGTVSLALSFSDNTEGNFFGGAVFNFEEEDLSAYDTLKFSIDTSAYTGFSTMVVQLELPTGGADGTFVSLADYTAVATSGNWDTYEIPLADFTAINPAAVIRLGFWNVRNADGDLIAGTLYLDDIHFTTASGGGNGNGGGDGGFVNGDFENGLTGWSLFQFPENVGSITADTSMQGGRAGTVGRLTVAGSAASANDAVISQEFLAAGTVMPGDSIDVTFDLYGSQAGAGGVVFVEIIFLNGAGEDVGGRNFLNGDPTPYAPTTTWTPYSGTVIAGTGFVGGPYDVSGGVVLSLKASCGAVEGCAVDASFDNVTFTIN